MGSDRARLRRLLTTELTPEEVAAIRALLAAAFGPEEDERFGEHDWQHALGGMHFVLDVDGAIVGHASVVERALQVDGRPLRTGYVEAVGVTPDRQGAGFAARLRALRAPGPLVKNSSSSCQRAPTPAA